MMWNLVRRAGKPENSNRTTTRRSGSASRSARLRNPHSKMLVAFEPATRVNQSPMSERAQRRAERIAGSCQPILVTHTATGSGSALDDPLAFQLAQPRDQHRARDQRYAAIDFQAMGWQQHRALLICHTDRAPASAHHPEPRAPGDGTGSQRLAGAAARPALGRSL